MKICSFASLLFIVCTTHLPTLFSAENGLIHVGDINKVHYTHFASSGDTYYAVGATRLFHDVETAVNAELQNVNESLATLRKLIKGGASVTQPKMHIPAYVNGNGELQTQEGAEPLAVITPLASVLCSNVCVERKQQIAALLVAAGADLEEAKSRYRKENVNKGAGCIMVHHLAQFNIEEGPFAQMVADARSLLN